MYVIQSPGYLLNFIWDGPLVWYCIEVLPMIKLCGDVLRSMFQSRRCMRGVTMTTASKATVRRP